MGSSPTGGTARRLGPDAPAERLRPSTPIIPLSRSWLAPFFLLASVWGGSFLFIKVSLDDLAPIQIAFLRCAIGAAVLFAALAIRRESVPREPRLWAHLTVAALLLNAVPFTLFGYGEQHASSVLAGIWNGTTPLFAVVFVWLALPDEPPTRAGVAGLVIGFIGVVLVLGPWSLDGGSAFSSQLMFAGAAACYGASFAYSRRYISHRETSGLALAAIQVLLGALILVPLLPIAGMPDGDLGADTALAMLALGALGTGLAYVLYHEIVRRAGATSASTVTYVIPVFSTILGVLVLGERVHWHEPAGAAIVLLGVAIAQERLGPARTRANSPSSSV